MRPVRFFALRPYAPLAVQNFPESVAAKQLRGLALRRTKKFQEAIDVMSELRAAGHQDPETLGILAAAFDGRYQETNWTCRAF